MAESNGIEIKEPNYLTIAIITCTGSFFFVCIYALLAHIALKKHPKDKISGMIAIVSISIFLFIFFFFIVTKLETDNAVLQINYGIDTLADEIAPMLSNNVLTTASNELHNFKIEDMSAQDIHAVKVNSNLKTETIIAMSFLLFFALCYIIFILWRNKKDPNGEKIGFKTILSETGKNLVVIFFVGIVQYIYLIFAVKKYTLVDTNLIKKTFLTTLKNTKPTQTIPTTTSPPPPTPSIGSPPTNVPPTNLPPTNVPPTNLPPTTPSIGSTPINPPTNLSTIGRL